MHKRGGICEGTQGIAWTVTRLECIHCKQMNRVLDSTTCRQQSALQQSAKPIPGVSEVDALVLIRFHSAFAGFLLDLVLQLLGQVVVELVFQNPHDDLYVVSQEEQALASELFAS